MIAAAPKEPAETKKLVHDFWNEASCGEALYLGSESSAYDAQARERYRLEPYIHDLAKFETTRGSNVLEIGVGLGADHEMFARAGAILTGVDLTERAVEHTGKRFAAKGLTSAIKVADAENLPFPDNSFDVVYSWGVLHHTPNTGKAIKEVHRVLKPGGQAKIMIYHKYSMIGYMLWLRYAFATFRWRMGLAEIYSRYLESPGTKAYSIPEAKALCSDFASVKIETVLTHGDLLTSRAGQRHEGILLGIARIVWPRFLIKAILPGHGLFMLIRAVK